MTGKTIDNKIQIWLERMLSALLLMGQVIVHILQGKINRRNTLEQMGIVGPDSLAIALITAIFVGAVFTIQVAREFLNFGAVQAIGGVLVLALSRELAPVLTAVVIAARVGSAFAAEIGTMKVTEQIDALYVLKSDPIDYLVVPRTIACCVMLPILTIISLVTGTIGGIIVSSTIYNISQATFIESIQDFLQIWDIISAMIKAVIFGGLIAIIGCSWGLTTTGGAKGVGQSTTTAVVMALITIFISNFFLSWLMFQGLGRQFLN
ncbi:MlaE family lipid ABC transporter permease subunit [Waterburya agarophytonicola K14]|uniref:MlaE family lipid ABC transporter permease subunit n=1 Tax=Waterburya agarophytonicola KI4 TaxID=2874699 RepID=A0A964C026_9CYAN|nr:MlaE family lipid ABC transporter permease subunit [Waterburya agarophytonicola]MCC0179746.1 MlaE family lipid ABC transporter permease subunit [Waterburya agarophytonicola KI4]